MNETIEQQVSKAPEERTSHRLEELIRELPEERARFCLDLLRRAQEIADRVNAVPVPSDPWIPGPHELAATRRTVARLRAGLIRPEDSTVDPIELADLLERGVEYRKLLRDVVEELSVSNLIVTMETGLVQAELADDAVATLHAAKHLPLAKDPNSSLSHHVRASYRALRQDLGRPRKPKRRGRKGEE
jgi:hypothetical protein